MACAEDFHHHGFIYALFQTKMIQALAEIIASIARSAGCAEASST